ncbi:hypothetical protein ILUMI_03660 [Ignelater luminosus]|uniref:PiggyBac transposable element-derived protein domain-containing protein n=1 Tax=Ignelater luminosus TaxID=2038154 RepID=A0A8K0DG57_IGNLU|nr:hypothetical protein ILUMI_03660 [Ignelater luminosus]
MTYEEQQDYIRQLADLLDGESDVDESQVDKEFISQTAQRESSDVEDVFEDSENRIGLEDENSSDDKSESSVDKSSNANCLFGKDKIVWHRTPPKTGRVRKHNLLHEKSGLAKLTQILSMRKTFKCIFSDVMCDIIIRETNQKANSVYAVYNAENPGNPAKVWKFLTPEEFETYLGIIITTGVNHSKSESTVDLWKTDANSLNVLTGLEIECVLGKPLVAADSKENPGPRHSPPRDATGRQK